MFVISYWIANKRCGHGPVFFENENPLTSIGSLYTAEEEFEIKGFIILLLHGVYRQPMNSFKVAIRINMNNSK